MSAIAGSALVGGMVWARELWNYWKPRRVGIYGPSMVGKTTLDRYMTTPGEMEPISEEDRTTHFKFMGHYLLPRATRKRVSWKGEKRVVFSADLGGEERFWNLWVDDMVNRKVEAVVFMFDDRAMHGGDDAIEAIGGFKYLVDCLLNRQYRYRNFKSWWKGKRYTPKLIILVANKADKWWDDNATTLWGQDRIGEHKIFDAFRPDLIRLQKHGIPTKRAFMATRIGWQVENTMIDLLSG